MEMDDRGLRKIFFEVAVQVPALHQNMADIEADGKAVGFDQVLDPFEGISKGLDRDSPRFDSVGQNSFKASPETLPPGFDIAFICRIEMKGIERWVKRPGPFYHLFCNGNSFQPRFLRLIAEGDIGGKMDVEAHPVLRGEFLQTTDLDIAGEGVGTLAFEENQFNLVEERSESGHIRNDLIGIYIRGRRQFEGELPPVILHLSSPFSGLQHLRPRKLREASYPG